MRKLGVNYSAKWGVPFAEFLKIIKDIGYDCFFTGVPKAENIPAMAQAAQELGKLNARRYEDNRIDELLSVIETEAAALKE